MIFWRATYGLLSVTFFAADRADAIERAHRIMGTPRNRTIVEMEPTK